jgi:hypothetical protein
MAEACPYGLDNSLFIGWGILNWGFLYDLRILSVTAAALIT